MPAAIDLGAPLSIEAVEWVDDHTIEILIATPTARMSTYWIMDSTGTIDVINPTPETREALGQAAALVAPRTFVGPVLNRLRDGVELALPISLPLWWQGADTLGWIDW